MAAIIQNVPTETTTAEINDTAQSQTGDTQSTTRKSELSLNSTVGTLLLAIIPVLLGILMWQISSLGNRIDNLDTQLSTEISSLRTELRTEINSVRTDMNNLETSLRTEINSLRTDMQTGFAEINTTLLDHTDRLARLETAAGLPRPNN